MDGGGQLRLLQKFVLFPLIPPREHRTVPGALLELSRFCATIKKVHHAVKECK